MTKRLLFMSLCLLFSTLAMAQTELSGTVFDDSNLPLPDATVKLMKGGALIKGALTDENGKYRMPSLDPGTFDLEVSYIGLKTQKQTGVVLKGGQETRLNISLSSDEGVLETFEVIEYRVPLIDFQQTSTGGTVTGDQVMKMATKGVNGIVATMVGASSVDGGAVSLKGSRSNGTNYYIDGIRVYGSLPPQSEIDQLQVITGGIAATYGDVTGGIISITTRGPAQKFGGGLELESSQYLDAFGYNLGSANLSGPILKRKSDSTTIIGFRISGQYKGQLDDDPAATTVYRVKDDVLANLEANPIINVGQSRLSAAELLTNDDMQFLNHNVNEERTDLDFTGKLEARLSKAVDVSLFGSYNDVNDKFTPSSGTPSSPWTVYNSHNNPTNINNRWRTNLRLRHRLGQGGEVDTSEAARSRTVISNASYSIQGGYEVYNELRQDPRHKDRYFDYGYIGKFDNQWVPFFTATPDTAGGFIAQHIDNQQQFLGYTPGTVNPVLARYNNSSDLTNINDLIATNGFIPNFDNAWNLHANVGQVYNLSRKEDSRTITGSANFTFDIVPKGKLENVHNIQFGLVYEQRVERLYSVSPFSLWQLAGQLANNHILGVDTNIIVGYVYPPYLGLDGLPVNNDSVAIYRNLISNDPASENLFYKSVREKANGYSLYEYFNVDGLTPDQLSLDMFSASELNEQNLLDYYGFDYLGNKLGTDVTFEDFFRATDPNTGLRTFPVAPIQPIYQAGYIQDKFKIGDDLIIRLGVRIDRFDANQKVLKDPYSLYEVMDANDFYTSVLATARPDNIGADYKVYVTGENATTVRAFRDGDQWYSSTGTAVDGRLLFGQAGLVYPFYKKAGTEALRIRLRDYDPNESFEDYTPQVNIMPRVAFSFPISDMANFFAHYDILVQRPSSNTIVTPLDFYYWESTGRFGTDNIRNNANLLPEKTIDYEVGYQQKLSDNSAIKIAAFYKEMRDMIQLRTLINLPSPVTSYSTFDNIDFGTVKGMTFQYDIRPKGSNNLNCQLNYTLQFADATGSDAESQKGLTNTGSNIRNLFPLNFDERHRLSVTADYRFASGRAYNGPKWFGTDIFARSGANIQLFAVSGRPYTAKFLPQEFGGAGTIGSINGARLPWTFQIDMRIDKDFKLGNSGKMLNVYVRSQNVLDARNVVNVYSATGSPTDDGYLASARGQQAIDNITGANFAIQSYLDSYQWRLLNPDNFSLPRRIFLGAIFNF
jgi:outer membrane receptor protein involved in Fe transport